MIESIRGPELLAGSRMATSEEMAQLRRPQSALDVQEGGDHYKVFKIQPIEFITKNKLPFIIGNVIKYAVRASLKNGIEDLRKAKHYLELEAELVYGEKL